LKKVPGTFVSSAPPSGSILDAGSFVVLAGQALAGSPFAPIATITVNGIKTKVPGTFFKVEKGSWHLCFFQALLRSGGSGCPPPEPAGR